MNTRSFNKIGHVFVYITIVTIISANSILAQKSDPLPDGWRTVNIGEPDLPSVTIYDKEEDFYTLSGGGYDTWGTADECNFVYFETEEDKEVVVRMLDFEGTGWNSKGFIMIRGSLDPGSSMCFLEATPHSGSSVYLSGRRENDGGCDIFGQHSGVQPLYPRWIKFVRQGRYITGYHKDDTEGASWQRVATVKLALKGKAYLGIGVCGGGGGTGYVTVSFDKLTVRDIEIPYEVVDPVSDQVIREGYEKEIDVTSVFGHFIGDYWTIDTKSSDDSIVSVKFWEELSPDSEDGEEYRKMITLKGIRDGVGVIRLSTNIKGFKMQNDFVVEVNGETVPSTVKSMSPPAPWKFNELYNTYLGTTEEFSSDPYKSLVIPGTIEAEDFDVGGYFDSDTINEGGEYRPDVGVDILADTVNIGDYAISKLDSGEWLEYTVDIETAGSYDFTMNLSSTDDAGQFHLKLDGENMIPVTTFKNTDGLYKWSTQKITGIDLNKGKHLMRLCINENTDTLDIAINNFVFDLTEELYETKKSQMEYSGSVGESIKILTELMNYDGIEDNIAYLYKDLDISDSIQMTAYIESVKNTGTGSFAGLMFRQRFDTTRASSPFVSFGTGAYEGLKLNFRWDEGVEVGALMDENITLPCWIRINKFSDFGLDYINTYYSYDGIYWNEFQKYPLNIKFLKDEVLAGVAVCGGSFAKKRKELATVKNLDIRINKPFDDMKYYSETLKVPMTISPNPVQTNAEIKYKILKPGRVMLTIYNVYGQVVKILVNDIQEIGEYTVGFSAQDLPHEGIYLLKLISEDNYEFLKFIYEQ